MYRCGCYLPCNTTKYKIIKLVYKKQSLSFGVEDEKQTIKAFLEALANSRYDEAKVYISKGFENIFDLHELSQYFGINYNYKYLVKAGLSENSKNHQTRSILVKEKGRSSIIHLHMIKEPDIFGKWKIYGIDKE